MSAPRDIFTGTGTTPSSGTGTGTGTSTPPKAEHTASERKYYGSLIGGMLLALVMALATHVRYLLRRNRSKSS